MLKDRRKYVWVDELRKIRYLFNKTDGHSLAALPFLSRRGQQAGGDHSMGGYFDFRLGFPFFFFIFLSMMMMTAMVMMMIMMIDD